VKRLFTTLLIFSLGLAVPVRGDESKADLDGKTAMRQAPAKSSTLWGVDGSLFVESKDAPASTNKGVRRTPTRLEPKNK
jgi:hypothetical protein